MCRSNRLNLKCVKKFAKFGGGCVIVWEGVVPLVRIIGTLNANVYLNLAEHHVTLSVEASPNQPASFMQDSAPCHSIQRVLKIILNKKMSR